MSEVYESQLLSLGRLSYLATYCPLHRQFPTASLARLFVPAINHQCVRFFQNETGQVCAALIWARLSDAVSERMIFDQTPPDDSDWVSGNNLWFLDLLAPFGHGRVVARHLARNPPEGPFYFARLGKGGKVRKVVRGDASAWKANRVRSFFIDPNTEMVS
ncbi:MAG: toxin-activating lysine-acyltransferase [Rhodobacter sp.]|nr:toxin-activating lysine-acyltransferase [Rhodobacter sp.]